MKDILWKKRVWRDIDATTKENNAFGYTAKKPGSSSLISMLISGVLSGKVTVYAGDDDRFDKKLTKEDFLTLINTNGALENVSGYKIKEDWLFVKSRDQMTVRIVGIAPEKEVTRADGTKTNKPLFWIYYPECRTFLAQFKVADKNNNDVSYNWNEYFEARQFKSKIEKVKSW